MAVNNSSAVSNSSAVYDEYLFEIYEKISITSAVFLSFVALGTVITNGVALVAIFKDPLKCFRNPMAMFITGILVSDFLTGLVVEPVIVATNTLWMTTELDIEQYQQIIRSSQILGAVTINTSFLTVLALAVSQLLALRWPSIYNRYVTSRLAVFGIVCVWVYAILFALLPETANMSIEIYFFVDLVLHTTLISVALVIIYFIIYFSFKRAMRRYEITAEAQQEDENRQEIPKEKVEKEFLVGSFMVILVLIITVWPFTITFYVIIIRVIQGTLMEESFWKFYIAFIVFDDILYLKFLLDPLIFVWRLSKYREAIFLVLAPVREKLCCAAQSSLPRAAYHRQQGEGDSAGEEALAPEWSTDISGAFINKDVDDEPVEA